MWLSPKTQLKQWLLLQWWLFVEFSKYAIFSLQTLKDWRMFPLKVFSLIHTSFIKKRSNGMTPSLPPLQSWIGQNWTWFVPCKEIYDKNPHQADHSNQSKSEPISSLQSLTLWHDCTWFYSANNERQHVATHEPAWYRNILLGF